MANTEKALSVDQLIIGTEYWLDNRKDESGIFKGIVEKHVTFEPSRLISYTPRKTEPFKGLIAFSESGAGLFYETV